MDHSNGLQQTQVVIAGAGPTGLSLAAQFIRYRIDFLILEKNAGTTALSKALVVQARSLEIFQELGIAEKAINEGQVTNAAHLFYKGKQRTVIHLSGLGEGLSPFPFALSLEQSKTEKLLADYLADQGKTIEWNAELTRFEQDENGVTAFYKNGDGQERKIKAAYLVGCDGAGSTVMHQLGLAFEGSTEPKLFYVADVLLKSPVINKNELYMYMIKKGFVLFFPMEGAGHYRLVGVVPEGEQVGETIEFSSIEQTIKAYLVTPVAFKELRWFSTYKVHSRKADAFMKGRCFLAGDAAHIHTPAGGQGMNTGIQDAYNLAWKIAYTLSGEAAPVVLKTYNSERTENAKHLLQTTDRIFDIMSGVNRFWNFLRLNFFPLLFRFMTKARFIQKRIFPLLSQTGIAYPNSPLTVKSSIGNVKAGDRMPYFVLANGRQIFSYLAEPAFKLLFFGNESKNLWKDFSSLKIKTINYHFQEIPRALFGREENFYLLLRPDNHISYIGKDAGKIVAFLNKIARP